MDSRRKPQILERAVIRMNHVLTHLQIFLCTPFPLPRICASWLNMTHYLRFKLMLVSQEILPYWLTWDWFQAPVGLLEFQPHSAPWWFQVLLTWGHVRMMAASCHGDNTEFSWTVLSNLTVSPIYYLVWSWQKANHWSIIFHASEMGFHNCIHSC